EGPAPALPRRAPMDYRDSPLIQSIMAGFGLRDDVTKEELEDHLRHAAATFSLPQFVPTVISGAYSAEVRTTMQTTDAEIAPISMQFNAPVLLIGFCFETLEASFNSGATIPSTKQVDGRIDFQREEKYATRRLDQPQNTGPLGYVPLSMLDLRLPRYFMKIL